MNNGECNIMTLQQFIIEHIEEWKAEAEHSNANTSVNTYLMTCMGHPFGLRVRLDTYLNKPYNLETFADLYGVAFKAPEVELHATPVKGVFTNQYDEWALSAYSVEGCKEDKFFVLAKEGWKYASLAAPEDSVLLDSGEHLMNKFGKYEPNICFISRLPHIMWRSTTPREYNLSPKCTLKYVRGTYFKSKKKGTNCFRLNENGPHVLLRDDWGGAFEKYRGGNLPEDQLYYRRASSNGGGCGYDYAVIPLGWRKVISEDDI